MELRCNNLPNLEGISEFVRAVKRALSPGFFDKEGDPAALEEAKRLFEEYICDIPENKETFFAALPKISESLKKDLQFAFDSDPACDSLEEIVYAYPGFSAILSYRIAHEIYAFGNKVAARVVSELAHRQTGIDINPGATIGSPFFIDHGTGIVIGETAVVGRYVKLYQGVTLGALTLSQGHALRGKKRHPTIGNYVTIYSGASILGDVNIGDNVVIGSNVFLMKSIEANHRVVIPAPELEIREKGGK